MQLKIARSQRPAVLGGKVVFGIQARVQFTPEEKASVTRYKLQNEVVYNSEAQKRLLERSAAQDTSIGGNFKAIALSTLAMMHLKITVRSLEEGQYIECKSLDELLLAEDALMEACRQLKSYLEVAATFDGREDVFSFESGQITHAASASGSQVIAPPAAPPTTPQFTVAAAKPAALPAPTYSDDRPFAPVASQPAPRAVPAEDGKVDGKLMWLMLTPTVLVVVFILLMSGCQPG